jgi:hypothetical protein
VRGRVTKGKIMKEYKRSGYKEGSWERKGRERHKESGKEEGQIQEEENFIYRSDHF